MLEDRRAARRRVPVVRRLRRGHDDTAPSSGSRSATTWCGDATSTSRTSSRAPSGAGSGHAPALMEWVLDEARRAGCGQVHLNSGVGSDRRGAHRFYFNSGCASARITSRWSSTSRRARPRAPQAVPSGPMPVDAVTMDKIVVALQAARLRVPLLGDLRRPRVDLRLRPLRRAAEDERQERVVARDAPASATTSSRSTRRSSSTRACGRPPATSPASPTRSSTAARASSASAPTTSTRTRCCPAKANLPKTEDRRHDLTEAREFNLMFETTVGPVKETGVDRLPAPGDRAGHLHQLQERPAVHAARSRRSASRRSASRSATRSRRATSSSARASSSRWRWSSSSRPPRRRSGTSTGSTSALRLVRATSASAPTTCACASTTPTS